MRRLSSSAKRDTWRRTPVPFSGPFRPGTPPHLRPVAARLGAGKDRASNRYVEPLLHVGTRTVIRRGTLFPRHSCPPPAVKSSVGYLALMPEAAPTTSRFAAPPGGMVTATSLGKDHRHGPPAMIDAELAPTSYTWAAGKRRSASTRAPYRLRSSTVPVGRGNAFAGRIRAAV